METIEEVNRFDLKPGEPHPVAQSALDYVISLSFQEKMILQESLASCAIESNRFAEICSETLRRVMHGEPVSDRYILGLAWGIKQMESLDNEKAKSKEKKQV